MRETLYILGIIMVAPLVAALLVIPAGFVVMFVYTLLEVLL
jgi:hypothetical protein